LRMLTLVLIRVFNYWGLAAGIILTLFLIITNPTISKERGYLYPLYPWDKRAMVRLLFRVRANKPK